MSRRCEFKQQFKQPVNRVNQNGYGVYWLLFFIAIFSVLSVSPASAENATEPSSARNQPVLLLDLQGAIGPATADYVIRGIDRAEEVQAQLVILRMDTPGGLDKSMRSIIKHVLSSPLPVAAYVAPSGARAASAGTYILYASHIAAMAPATNIGAATPVQIAPLPNTKPSSPLSPEKQDDGEDRGSPLPSNTSAMEKKILNDAIAYIEGLAELRGRDKEWAIRAVRDGASLTASEALQRNIIEIIASDVPDLLSQLDQRKVAVDSGEVILQTGDAAIVEYQPDWRNRFLSVITDPNIAYILMLVGIYGLIFEFSNPGMVGPGIAGLICLLLAFYAFQVLPVSYTGALLILLGIILIVVEALIPSWGVFGLGGVIAFVIGSIILMDTELPAYQIARPLIVAVALSSAAVFLLIMRMLMRSRQAAVVSGVSSMLGQLAMVEDVQDSRIWVRINGERWSAHSDDALEVGDSVCVEKVDGLELEIRKRDS